MKILTLGEQIPADERRDPIHRKHQHLNNLSTEVEILETGIKVVDLFAPYIKGGKIGLFGGAGVGKTVLNSRINQQHRTRARWYFRIRWCW